MEQLTKNQAVATSQEAVQNQNEPQLRDENAHNDKSVHGVLNPTYQAGLRRDAVQPDIEAERKKRDATIQRINIIGSREGSRNRRRLKANQTGKKFRVGIKSNISTNRNNLISGVDRCIHLNAMKKTTIT